LLEAVGMLDILVVDEPNFHLVLADKPAAGS
jgi:hypothetical protein